MGGRKDGRKGGKDMERRKEGREVKREREGRMKGHVITPL